MKLLTAILPAFILSLPELVPALSARATQDNDRIIPGAKCEKSKYKSGIYPISPTAQFTVDVIPVSDHDIFDNRPQHLVLEKEVTPGGMIEFVANPLIYTGVGAYANFTLESNGTLTTSGVSCGLVWEEWKGQSQTPACPAISTLQSAKQDWIIKSACIDNLQMLLLLPTAKREGLASNEVWRVENEKNPGHQRVPRLHYGKLENKKGREYIVRLCCCGWLLTFFWQNRGFTLSSSSDDFHVICF
ncbi:hypothetical protein BJ875DRAFT_163541 [Amylocarpus encephaloides]|uniref:Ubiquitin 3 binding protein But2 C-terminal domain-containing protein n=1 Tax=Amylocarpus encephaloides TaxID=45428 RepID=A0A9P8C192_9HELO|nr:hypothetical protein BJ875DRAFT_163541 [Amylocarpus encephaloides]